MGSVKLLPPGTLVKGKEVCWGNLSCTQYDFVHVCAVRFTVVSLQQSMY